MMGTLTAQGGTLSASGGTLADAGAASSAVDDFNAVAHTTFDVTNDDGVAALTDGDPIPDLDDQTGNGHDATQGTAAKRPVAQTVSGMKVARFDGADDVLSTASFTALTQPTTIVALVKSDDADTNTRTIVDGIASSGTARNTVYSNSGKWYWYAGSVQSTGIADDADWHVFVVVFDGASSAFHLDGGTPISTANPGTGAPTGVTIGGFYTTTGNLWDGDLNFLGLYPGDLATDDLTLLNSLGQELADRAGITWTDVT